MKFMEASIKEGVTKPKSFFLYLQLYTGTQKKTARGYSNTAPQRARVAVMGAAGAVREGGAP